MFVPGINIQQTILTSRERESGIQYRNHVPDRDTFGIRIPRHGQSQLLSLHRRDASQLPRPVRVAPHRYESAVRERHGGVFTAGVGGEGRASRGGRGFRVILLVEITDVGG